MLRLFCIPLVAASAFAQPVYTPYKQSPAATLWATWGWAHATAARKEARARIGFIVLLPNFRTPRIDLSSGLRNLCRR